MCGVEHVDEARLAALVGAGRPALGVGRREEEHVAGLDERAVAVADGVAHQQVVDPVGEGAGVEPVLQRTAAVVEPGSHGPSLDPSSGRVERPMGSAGDGAGVCAVGRWSGGAWGNPGRRDRARRTRRARREVGRCPRAGDARRRAHRGGQAGHARDRPDARRPRHGVAQEYVLWQSGGLDRLPEGVGHAVLDGWTEGDDTTVIVMRDLGDTVLTWDDRLDARRCRWVLDRVAALHRAYLGDPPDAVVPLAPMLDMFAPVAHHRPRPRRQRAARGRSARLGLLRRSGSRAAATCRRRSSHCTPTYARSPTRCSPVRSRWRTATWRRSTWRSRTIGWSCSTGRCRRPRRGRSTSRGCWSAART